jgi:hypothetical protein
MRLLILAALATSCYSPAVEDCQFSCGADGSCPSGTTCMGGVCRSGAGTCSASMVDANPPADASMDAPACPAPPAGCGAAFRLPTQRCAVICTQAQVNWSDADGRCAGAWRLGILDSAAALAAVPAADKLWVGARRNGMVWRWETGVDVSAAAWTVGSPVLVEDNCAYLTTQRKLSNIGTCDDNIGFVCTARAL